MDRAECIVAAFLIVGMIDPGVQCESGTVDGTVDLEERSIEDKYGRVDIVANTTWNFLTKCIVDFEIGRAAIGIHELERNRNVTYRISTIVGNTQFDGIFLVVDTAAATRRDDFGDGDIVVERRIDSHGNAGVIAGAVARTEATEIIERVVEVLGCRTPVGRAIVVIVTIVEELATCGVTVPTDDTAGRLCRPEIAVCAIVDQGVVTDRHLGSVVGSDADVIGGIVNFLSFV